MATNPHNQRTYRRNIRRTLATATAQDRADGLAWYGRARDVAAELQAATDDRLNLRQCAAILAITSQGTSWSANVTKARKAVGQYLRGERIHRIGMQAEPRIERAIAGDPDGAVSGPKLTAFYRSILGEQHAPVIDRWAARIALGDPGHDGRITPAQNREMAAAFTAVASETDLTPCELQAVTWVAFRNRHARALYDLAAIEEVAA